ncbi:glycosyltransferase family 2 protein [Pseudomonas sp. Env-44]|jgi:alpha-1,3-rhamnosyltransferase|uniref:glycosyltransferase family 2 protein n=1 Tax=unclassified Pseudomonas TaxID=196821 RepID=UPI000CD3EA03|nr:glycosyltransferase family 2 protein [Pseudomonas sp. 770NI]MBJ2235126.1 glycosyltransferase family 2 protein [Pseudomonas fluorescens]POH41546.1 glycosyl transferase family 2 [Pseudomonas fluorescens]PRW67241.1 glycosyltransferase family 2 protein [Pseudomonas fluorescens]RZI21097.1 glycosyltransferase family 2 protein [Pseudomonas sp. 770NI]
MLLEKESAGPLVSMCIPVYNHQKFVERSIRSVINQSYANIELIIIDDGSSDLSRSFIQDLLPLCEQRFVRFTYIAQVNQGLSTTLNTALEWSQGKYFSALASDDCILPEKTEFLIQYLESQPDCVAAFGSIYLIDDESRRTSTRIGSGRYSFRDVIMLKAQVPAAAGMLRLDTLRSVGGFNTNTRVEDWDMWLKLTSASNGYLQALPELVAEYRQHAENTLKQLDLMYEHQMKILQDYRECPEYTSAITALECTRFRNIASVRKKEALGNFLKLSCTLGAYKEIRFYQGIIHLFFKW